MKPLIALESFIQGLELLPDETFSEIQDTEKKAELEKIRKELAHLEGRLAALRCPPLLQMSPNGGFEDIRQKFFDHRARKQSGCNRPCTASGLDLRGAGPDETGAFERLGIGRFVNSKSRAAPAPRD